ncbi:MAG: ribose transporter permease [Rhizobium sp.]|nr:ribose transporter permease [Rhizobium sp.]
MSHDSANGAVNSLQPAAARRTLTTDQRDLLSVSAILLLVVIIATITSGGTFLQPENLANVLQQNTVLIVLAMAQFIIILTGGVDLSVGSVVAFASVLFIGNLDHGMGAAFLIAVLAGALIGLLNGLLVVVVRLPSFVATLGSMQIIYSVSKLYTGGGTLHAGLGGAPIPDSFKAFFDLSLFGIPYPAYAFILVFIIAAIYLRSSIGYFLYAIGNNANAVRLAGIPANRNKVLAYVFASAITAVGGVLFAARVSYGDPQAGLWLPLDTIAAVSIGGASLLGGRGTILATIFGVLIIAILNNTMNLIGISPTFQPAIKGIVIVLTVYLYSRRSS